MTNCSARLQELVDLGGEILTESQDLESLGDAFEARLGKFIESTKALLDRIDVLVEPVVPPAQPSLDGVEKQVGRVNVKVDELDDVQLLSDFVNVHSRVIERLSEMKLVIQKQQLESSERGSALRSYIRAKYGEASIEVSRGSLSKGQPEK